MATEITPKEHDGIMDELFSEIYNQAIDHAISIISEMYNESFPECPSLTNITNSLSALKKA